MLGFHETSSYSFKLFLKKKCTMYAVYRLRSDFGVYYEPLDHEGF